ncbi:hypothetical protein ACROYT_G015401 [Oculina patagonica]
MDAVCLQATWNKNFNNLPKDMSDDKLTVETVVSERVRVADLSASELALLEAGLVLESMSRESKQEKINAVYKAQFNRGQTELAKKLDAIEKELNELKRAVSEVEKYVLEKVAEGEKLRRELPSMHVITDKDEQNKSTQEQFTTTTVLKGGLDTELFQGKDYFEAQSSWFDLLANNIGCLDIQFNPVPRKEKKNHNKEYRMVGNTSHENADTPSERIKAEDYFDVQPSWFDTLVNNTECLDIEFSPEPKGQGESRGLNSIPSSNVDATSKRVKDDVCRPRECPPSITPAANEPEGADMCFSLSTRDLFVDSDDSVSPTPSWFDTLPNNIGCLEIKNLPVLTEESVSKKEDPASKEIQVTLKNSSPK